MGEQVSEVTGMKLAMILCNAMLMYMCIQNSAWIAMN